MAKHKYWTLYLWLEKKYGLYLCMQEFRKLPIAEQRKYFGEYKLFIKNYTNGGKYEYRD